MTSLGPVRTLLVAIAWLAVASLIALGGAGFVAALDHPPGTAARAELTWAGDQAARPAIDAATDRLAQVTTDADLLGTAARLALTQVVAGDTSALTTTITDGASRLVALQGDAAVFEASLTSIPGIGAGSELRLSPAIRQRYDALVGARGVTAGLGGQWQVLAGRALEGANLAGLLALHDRQTAAAAAEGTAAHYAAALKALDAPDATLAQIRQVRDRLAPTTDVTTLTSLIDRDAAYDTALRNLYKAMLTANGRVTDAVRRAYDAQRQALAALPSDNRPLVVIMSDIAGGGLNQAVIAIEAARGTLKSSLDLQRQLQSGSPLPG